jgi:hypothetical protein
MTEWTGVPEASRLDELAAVTRECGKYSRTAFGFALAVPGGWILLALAVAAVSVPLSRVAFAVGPVLWLVLLPRARDSYQRHGRVVGPDADTTGFAIDILTPVVLWTAAVLGVRTLLREKGAWAGTPEWLGWLAVLVCAAGYVATPLLARRRVEAATDRSLTFAFAAYAVVSLPDAWWPALAALFGLVCVARGAYQHVVFRRLERRLAALKGTAP